MDSMLVQIIIGVNLFLLGGVMVLAIQHARAHFRPQKPAPGQQSTSVAPQLRQQLMTQAQERYNAVLE